MDRQIVVVKCYSCVDTWCTVRELQQDVYSIDMNCYTTQIYNVIMVVLYVSSCITHNRLSLLCYFMGGLYLYKLFATF
jgi:hypothetical protein